MEVENQWNRPYSLEKMPCSKYFVQDCSFRALHLVEQNRNGKISEGKKSEEKEKKEKGQGGENFDSHRYKFYFLNFPI